MIKREETNPILIPEEKWEKKGAFSPSVVKTDYGYRMVYRAVDEEGRSTIATAESKNGLVWRNKKILVFPSEEWDKYGCEDPRLTRIDEKYYIFYTAISIWPPKAEGIRVAVAISSDLVSVEEKHPVTPFNAKAAALLAEKVTGQYVLAITVNTDRPPEKIGIAKAEKIESFWDEDFWKDWYCHIEEQQLKLGRLNTDLVEVGVVPIKVEEGWLWFYAHIRNYYSEDKRIFAIEAVITDGKDLLKIIKRTDEPLLVPKEEYEMSGQVKNVIFPSGVTDEGKEWRIYYGAADTFVAAASVNKEELDKLMKKNRAKEAIKLEKYKNNPILTVNDKNHWEKKAVFNPGVVYEEGKFFMVYRALSPEMVSTFGCAMSEDGLNFCWRSNEPIYLPRMAYEQKMTEGNNSGCEDPRITKISDKYYMFYTAYDGKGLPRVAMTCINVKDFLKHNWLWSAPILVSPPSEDNKNACLFPEKIKGRYVIAHRVGGRDIAIDWLDDLRHFDGVNWLEKEGSINRIGKSWQGEKIGIAGPPIKTDRGWLLIYHGVSDLDKQYRLGAMLLDLLDPVKVLARTKYPILEPTEEFEKNGITPNVVFSCGEVMLNGVLYVYYGGADQAIGVATIKMEKLMDYLDKNIS